MSKPLRPKEPFIIVSVTAKNSLFNLSLTVYQRCVFYIPNIAVDELELIYMKKKRIYFIKPRMHDGLIVYVTVSVCLSVCLSVHLSVNISMAHDMPLEDISIKLGTSNLGFLISFVYFLEFNLPMFN